MSGGRYFGLGQGEPVGFSMRPAADGRSVSATDFAGIFMATGSARAPSEPAPSGRPASQTQTARGAEHPPVWWQTALIATLLAAMLASRYLQFSNGGVSNGFFTTAFLLRDVIAALTAFPLVYSKVQLRADQPLLVQLGLIFTAGMGWQHLVFSVR